VQSPGTYRLPDQPLPDPFADPVQLATGLSYQVLKETDPILLRRCLIESALTLFRADAATLLEVDGSDRLHATDEKHDVVLPESGRALEPRLAALALVAGKSLISNHPRLYPELRELAAHALRDGVLAHAMLIRAHGTSHGVLCVHWIGRDRPPYEDRRGAYAFWDNVGLAIATSNERQRLQKLALYDELTGLPNQLFLHDELERRLRADDPVALLHVDFDGMREANNSHLGYEAGGDFLIRTVGQAIPGFLEHEELTARLHRAGDEFACVLEPGADAARRAKALERALDELEIPESHRPFYGGASVGYAVSAPADTPASLLQRAAKSMRQRKVERKGV
jgi:diguanylate cyclase (GGDEF)-like protein